MLQICRPIRFYLFKFLSEELILVKIYTFMKKISLLACVATLCILSLATSISLFAQGGGGPVPDPTPTSGTNNVPIDGGISLLAAAGVAYGAKKLHDARKKNS